jgi:chorismate mutase
MPLRGIRGAITVEENTADAILSATRTLLEQVIAANTVRVNDIASVIFTATTDLDAAYPAVVAREMGWVHTPLLCMQEMKVQESLPRCIRVLIHWNTDRTPENVQHVYLGEAQKLRPDLINNE